jgi:protease IV
MQMIPPPPPPPPSHRPEGTPQSHRPEPSRPLSFGQFLARTTAAAAVAVASIGLVTLVSLVATAGVISQMFSSPAPTGPFDSATSVGGTAGAQDWVLVIPVEGPILATGGGGLLNATGGAEVRDLLVKAAETDHIKAVVLELSTPGGTIPGSIDIADGVRAVQAAGKPVVAYVRDLSASGGMWAMAPADRIVAHPGSVVGSIGVIFGPLRYYDTPTAIDDGVFGGGVVTEGGIEEFYITAGTGKDLGNPFRRMTEAERSALQRHVNGSYDAFVAHVSTYRDLDEAVIRDDIGAMVFRADEAVRLGLVDEVGNRDRAWAAAAEAAGLESFDVRTVSFSTGLFESLFGASAEEVMAARTTSGVASLCATTAYTHAYYGDLSAACRVVR